MKKCPHCAEEIQDDAKICRFCNRSVVARGPTARNLLILGAIIFVIFVLVTLSNNIGKSIDSTVAAMKPSSSAPAASTTPASNDPVAAVKNGVLQLDTSVTIGNAFDHYKYFPVCRWRTLQAENGRTVVQVDGAVDFQRLTAEDVAEFLAKYYQELGFPKPASDLTQEAEKMLASARRAIAGVHILVEFAITQDGSFTYRTTSVQAIKPDKTLSPELVKTQEDSEKLLTAIYDNRLPDVVLSAVLAGSMAQ